MPTYSFRNRETSEVTEQFMRMGEKDGFLAAHPELESVITSGVPFGDPIKLGIRKVPGSMRETLQRISAAHPGNNIRIR